MQPHEVWLASEQKSTPVLGMTQNGPPQNRVAANARRRDMKEAIAEMRVLISFGLMTPVEANRLIARLEEAR